MKKKILSVIIAVLVTSFFIRSFIVIEKRQLRYEEQSNRLNAIKTLTGITDAMQRELDKSFEYTEFLDMIITEDKNISTDMLREYSNLILDRNETIKNIQIAPEGVIKWVYPQEGNEKAIGHDLMSDPKRSPYVEAAIEERIPITQGPVEALQGGLLVFSRKAIYVVENGIEKFWGLSIVTLDFNELIKKCGLSPRKEGYYFAFRAPKPDTRNDFLWGEHGIFEKDPLIKTVETGDQKWEVGILPEDGWYGKRYFTVQMDKLFLIIAIVIFALVSMYINLHLKIFEDARLDPLTRTLNKKYFRKYVEKKLKQKNKIHGFIVLDMDDFKSINDNFGHPVGDSVIIEVSKRIRSVLRNTDRLSRFGGDEYSVFIYNAGNEGTVNKVRDRILEAVNSPMELNGLKLDVSVSAGTSVFPQDGTSFNELLRISDQRMYSNKEMSKHGRANA